MCANGITIVIFFFKKKDPYLLKIRTETLKDEMISRVGLAPK